ncbi:hypothetical protein [Marmoricola sp. RAF53]|uniref:hypothetical protein n=1 Tax=Marmoricola sp. RAF53 TaxID=3233059 RepID=UPI003F9B7A21
MGVDPGKFRLYSRIEPPLKAGSYRFTTRQNLGASDSHGPLGSDKLPVEELVTHVRVRSPQYVLPTDQVLSTFPPAGREGSFGSRLPQVVLRRRTLPWERTVDEAHPDEPWLALVLIAEGEAELRLNQKVADCVTPGVRLDTPADVEQGNTLAVRQSAVHRIFPTREEVRLLAHAREVDINDTELMMGDDDGFLAVVISNRLPLPARDADGKEAPVKYLACLVNLCGQWDRLLAKAPPHVDLTLVPELLETRAYSLADVDHARMNLATGPRLGATALPQGLPKGLPKDAKAAGSTRTGVGRTVVDAEVAAPYAGAAGWASVSDQHEVANIYTRMAAPFGLATTSGFIGGDFIAIDPELRFPVLLHWSFTSTGDETFRSIMESLQSGLLGTEPKGPAKPGRPPLEIVETGHAGLAHRLRGGDEVRSWYRGPFVPHPTEDPPGGRLDLAHAADQVRTVVPDGREDISLASAFEIGRLLALSRPSVVAALVRWRQQGYQTASLLGGYAGARLTAQLTGLLAGIELEVDRAIGSRIGGLVADRLVEKPADVLGDPSPLVRAGRPVLEDRAANQVLARGLGLDPALLDGTPDGVLAGLEGAKTRRARVPELTFAEQRDVLAAHLTTRFSRAAVQALAPQLRDGTLDLGDVRLPGDLQEALRSAARPAVGELRRRLDLDVDLGTLPHGADPLDLLMHARPVEPDEEDER